MADQYRFSRPQILLVVVFLGFLVVPQFGEPFYTRLFMRIMIYGMVAVSLDLLLGYGGMVSFGHAAFFGLGAYTVGILAQHGISSAFLSWPLAVLVAAAVAVVVGALSLRTSGAYFIMITLAFAQMLYYFVFGLEAYGGSDGMPMVARNSLAGIVDTGNQNTFYYLVLCLLAATLYICAHIVNSRFGAVIKGVKENEQRMRSLGYRTFPYKLVCFVISGGMAGFAGALVANQTMYISPSLLHWTQSGHILVMVILGGMGTLYGPMLGAVTLLLAEEFLSGFTEHWMIVLGPFLIVMVLFARSGIYGLLGGARESG